MSHNRPSAVLARVKQALRDKYAWPGGYPLYIVTEDGGALSIDAARANWAQIVRSTLTQAGDGWQAVGAEINYEDGELICDHSGVRIESAYAEPEAPKARPLFNVTYEIVTPESAEQGDVDERGYAAQDTDFRTAIRMVQETRTNRVSGVECVEPSCSDIGSARWVTVQNGMEYETGAQESRSLHFPDQLTPATRKRICRLLGVRS